MNILEVLKRYGEEEMLKLTDETLIIILGASSPNDIKRFLESISDDKIEQVVVLYYKQIVQKVLKN